MANRERTKEEMVGSAFESEGEQLLERQQQLVTRRGEAGAWPSTGKRRGMSGGRHSGKHLRGRGVASR